MCIMMTAYADVDSAVMAIDKGVFHYVRKPLDSAELVELVDLAFETNDIKDEKRKSDEALKARNKEPEVALERFKKKIK